MHAVCCIKQVPDTAEVKIDPDTNTLVRSGVESITNPYDLVAVEAAVRLREKYGGRVSAICMGPPQAKSSLGEALSLGADAVYLLSDRAFAGADTLATSYTLTKAIERLHADHPVDLVVCGKQAIDGDTAQTGPGIATRLGMSQLTYVIEVDHLDPDKGEIQVRRQVEGGTEVALASLPALLTVELECAPLRRASLPLVVQALETDISVWDAAAIQGETSKLGIKGSPTWVRAITAPPPKEGGPTFDGRGNPAGAVEDCLDQLEGDHAFWSKLIKKWES
jgi:electron transfer flavoprotein beta subunit